MRRSQQCFCLFLLALSLAVFSACGPKEIPPDETEMIRTLGDSFVKELQNDILPLKDSPEDLSTLGYVVVRDDVTYGADTLYEAYGKYRMGEDCSVTIVFSSKSYVAANIVFSGGNGYYFRYEYDQFNPDKVSASGRVIDDMKLEITELPPKIELQMLKNKREVVRFTLRNPVEMAEDSQE